MRAALAMIFIELLLVGTGALIGWVIGRNERKSDE